MKEFEKAVEAAKAVSRQYRQQVWIIVQRKGIFTIQKNTHVLPADATHGAYMNGVAITK